MKKPTQVSNAIVAKCDDGAFRKITVVESDNDSNAVAKYGQTMVQGTYLDGVFVRAAQHLDRPTPFGT